MRTRFVRELSLLQNPFIGYSIGWLGGILTSLLFLFAFFDKRWVSVAISLLVALGVYMGAYQKWILGTIPFLLLMLAIARSHQDGKLQTVRVFKAFALLVFLSHVIKSIFRLQIAVDLPIRRAILDPAVMFQYYVQFAQEYDYQFWSDSKISRFFNPGPEQTVAQIIGERYFNLPNYFFLERPPAMNATSGLLADGIAQAGLVGLLVSSCLMFILFWLLSLLSKGRDFTIVFAITGLTFIILMEGVLHTNLLSRGLILVPIVMFFLPRVRS
jgi:hypothetical protein